MFAVVSFTMISFDASSKKGTRELAGMILRLGMQATIPGISLDILPVAISTIRVTSFGDHFEITAYFASADKTSTTHPFSTIGDITSVLRVPECQTASVPSRPSMTNFFASGEN